jgi:hypothetical protein
MVKGSPSIHGSAGIAGGGCCVIPTSTTTGTIGSTGTTRGVRKE